MKHCLLVFLTLLCLPLSGKAEQPLKIVASFSIIGDMVKQIAGNDADLKTLVGANGDAHEYEPTAADAKTIAQADIVFINGLGLEGWIERLIKSSGYKGKVITLTAGITPLKKGTHEDPHAWQDIENAKIYVRNISATLQTANPTQSKKYKENTDAYINKLTEVDGWVKQKISKIPPEKRKVISMHDAFQYFARQYGIEFIAPLGNSTESDVSAADMARIIDAVRKRHITAIFLENMTDSRLIKQLESDAKAHIGGTLYSDALSEPDGPAADYIGLFRHNVAALTAAMQNNPAPNQ